jgi:hypothetical protein
MNNSQLLQAIRLMIIAKNWQAYLDFRRQFIAQNPDWVKEIKQLLHSLPDDVLIPYCAYFGCAELPERFRKQRKSKPLSSESANSRKSDRTPKKFDLSNCKI